MRILCTLLFGLAAVISATFTVRSYWRKDTLSVGWSQRTFALGSLRGKLANWYRIGPTDSQSAVNWESSEPIEGYDFAEEFDRSWCGFGAGSRQIHLRDGTAVSVWKVMVRLDVLAIVLACIAAVPWMIRRRREASCKCPSCGYLLRTIASRCPECGNAVTMQAIG